MVYEYYAAGKGTNFKPYKAAAASAILALGIQVDDFKENQKEAAIQAGLIRLGKELGSIDGQIGRKTQKALEELEITFNPNDVDTLLIEVENAVQKKFSEEYKTPSV